MTRLPLFWATLALLPAASAGAEPERTYLASVTGIALGPNEYVDAFAVNTWGVDFIAVCHIPPGWEVRAGRRASPDGVLAGRASHGVTFLGRAHLSQLGGLALIRLPGPVQRTRIGDVPATFSGHAEIGTYGTDDDRHRQVRLSYANVRLVPATRCPPPAGLN
jgi:hypothetical protein